MKKDPFYILNNKTDLLQKGDEFQEPLYYHTKGAGKVWHVIDDKRAGGKPNELVIYRRRK